LIYLHRLISDVGLCNSSGCEVVRISSLPFELRNLRTHFIERLIGLAAGLRSRMLHFTQLEVANDSQDDSEDSDSSRRPHGSPNRPLLGGFIFLLGFALMVLAFYIADEPRPPFVSKILTLVVGLCAILCIVQGVVLICR
jgi:peptidoglycan/LPS O-acetylase OafA/YrhL